MNEIAQPGAIPVPDMDVAPQPVIESPCHPVTLSPCHPTTPSPRHSAILSSLHPRGFLTALQFLTIVPPILRRPFRPEELGQAVGWFGLVGLLFGAALAGVDYAIGLLFPAGVSAALLLALWVIATGGLHLDGFLDSCDGVLGGHTPEARLHIMRDERVGAFAVIGGVLLLLVKYSCLAALPSRTIALIIAATIARGGMAVAVVLFPYARPEGTGRWMKDHAGWRQAALASITVLVTAALAADWRGLAIVVLAAITMTGAVGFLLRRLPGLTGDTYGGLCELLETVTLLAFVGGEKI
jgi:adenosylcobinamide-GDP ribazoletransferase